MREPTVSAGVEVVRNAVGLARDPRPRVLTFSGGAAAYDTLDDLCTMRLPPREEAALGLWLDEQAHVIAEVLLVRAGRTSAAPWTLVVDTEIEPVAHAWCHLRPGAQVTEIDHAVLHVVGPNAPGLVEAAFGAEVAGAPVFGWRRLMRGVCVRFTKVGEHGYTLVLPRADADRVESALFARGESFGLARVSHEAVDACAIQNGFSRVSREPPRTLDPVAAGMQWLTSPQKSFVGSGALRRLQLAGTRERLTVLLASGAAPVGARVSYAAACVGEVIASAPGRDPAETTVVALVRSSHAPPGIDGFVIEAGDTRVLARTVTAPVVIDPTEPLARDSVVRVRAGARGAVTA